MSDYRQGSADASGSCERALRSVQLQIDLAAIRHNFAIARRLCDSRVFAVLKADAYGHGAVAVANALTQADGFAVVNTAEAVALREAGIAQPILVLQGPQAAAECDAYIEHKLWPVIHDLAQHAWFRRWPKAGQLDVWLKVDTGMGRLGVAVDAVTALLGDSATIRWKGVLSHLACADEPGHRHTRAQIDTFHGLPLPSSLQRSLANSAGVLAWPAASADWARPGVMLYGSNPLQDAEPADAGLEPAMQVSAPLIAVKDLARGAGIGYAQTYTCTESMRIGYAAIGYADGLPRVLDQSASVLVAGRRCAIVGRVSMDSIAIDLRSVPQAVVGDQVILWGPDHPVERLAKAAGTITYALLTGIRGQRTYLP